MITRRKLIVGLSAGSAAASLAYAQRRPRVIGVLRPDRSADVAPLMVAFVQAMLGLGYVEGAHFVIVSRIAEGRDERLRDLAEELAKLNVDLILTASTNAVHAARRATTRIPIVFVEVTDPVGSGFAESLARPRHNMTGLSNFASQLHSKRIDLLKQMVPGLARFAFLVNPTSPFYPGNVHSLQTLADQGAMRMLAVSASKPDELDPAFKAMTDFRAQAVYVTPDTYLELHRQQIADLALRSRLPSMYGFADYVEAGGLMSYGADTDDQMLQAAIYVDKIFKGADPGEIPIQQATKIDLVINRKTASSLQLMIPQLLLLQAARVIE